MPIPNAERAIIPAEKLRDYLLSLHHPEGRSKAAFFARLGYRREEWEALERDLRAQHLTLDAEETHPSEYGRKFVIRGPMLGLAGVTAQVVSIWMVRRGEDVPRFVTAYPGERK